MHTETRCGIDLDNRTTDFLVGFGNILGQKIDAADIQSHCAYGPLGHFAIIRMNLVGQIDGCTTGRQIGGVTQIESLTIRQYRIGVKSCGLE